MGQLLNPFNLFLWAYSRNEQDVIDRYNFLSDLMYLTAIEFFKLWILEQRCHKTHTSSIQFMHIHCRF